MIWLILKYNTFYRGSSVVSDLNIHHRYRSPLETFFTFPDHTYIEGESLTCSGSISWAKRLRSKRKETSNHEGRKLIPPEIHKLLSSRRKPNRLLEVYRLLLAPVTWVSAGDLNKKLKYVKRTLQGTLNRLVDLGLVKKTRSLQDARITLFRAITPWVTNVSLSSPS